MRPEHRATALAAGMLLAAAIGASARADSPDSTAVGNWSAVEITGRPLVHETTVTLDLGADGRAGGKSGCNGYGGPVTLGAGTIRFGPLAGTRMACREDINDQEFRYLDALDKARNWTLDDGRLMLRDATGSTVAVFEPQR